MFCSFFLKESPLDSSSALEGIVFKEGKGTFIKHFWKKRLLAYDEVAKCLRYYTPQRVLKDILFITPGRSQGKDARKDNVFEITIPGRVYVFHVNHKRETKKWIGILSRELDSLKIRDRIQLSNGNFHEGTYFKTLRPNSVLLNSLKIGDHREHEECCFLFDEEHQHKLTALESLCSLQAMKIYELSHEVQLVQQKISGSETPPSEEILSLREENKKLRFSYTREQIRVLDLKAKMQEAEETKLKEQDKQLVQKVVKHNHMDVGREIKVVAINPSTASSPKKPPSQASKTSVANQSFVNLPTLVGSTNNSKVEEIKKLTEELRQTRELLAVERAKVHECTQRHQGINFATQTSPPSPVVFESSSPTRSPMTARSNNAPKLPSIHETESSALNIKPSALHYSTFTPNVTPNMLANAYINHVSNNLGPRDPIHQLSTHPSSPQTTRPPVNTSPQPSLRRVEPPLTNPPQPSKLAHTPLQANAFAPHDVKLAASTSTASAQSTDALSSDPSNSLDASQSDFNLRMSLDSIPNGSVDSPKTVTSKSVREENFLDMNGSIELVKAFSYSSPVNSPQIAPNKPRSYSTTGAMAIPVKPIALRPNGIIDVTTSVPDAHPRSRTNSNPPPYKYSLSVNSLSSSPPTVDTIFVTKFANEIAEMLSSRFPDDNGVATQFTSKLSEMMTEVSKLSALLRAEQDKVMGLNEERSHMLDSMEGILVKNTTSGLDSATI